MASGVYECAQSQTTPRNYLLEEWDILDETPDQERPDGEATSAQTLKSSPDGSAPDGLAPKETTLPIELQTIGLGSDVMLGRCPWTFTEFIELYHMVV